MEIFVDVPLSYAIDPQHIPDFYVKYRVSDLDLFTHSILRDIARNSLNEIASTYNVEDIYGDHKTEFLHKVEAESFGGRCGHSAINKSSEKLAETKLVGKEPAN